MKNIDIPTTLKYTKELSLLYVEDDINLQTQTKELFESLFGSLRVTSDGKEALEAYMDNDYDMVISDVKMPKMNGVELAKEIKDIKQHQEIIITSAYNDSENLLNFINLNISNFILKPINTQNLINTIYNVAKNIVNTKMVESYRKDLESTNVSLKEKNDELQSLVRILDSKLAQLSSVQKKENKNRNFDELIISKVHLDELKELETDISGASVIISLSKNITEKNIQVLGDMFASYGEIVAEYTEYIELKEKIELLANSLSNSPDNFIKRVDDISILLESFIYVLRIWRKNLVENDAKKAFELHASMINDISTIIAIIDGTENDIESEMEFF
jgi:YesN/AraC family two-component response regulator